MSVSTANLSPRRQSRGTRRQRRGFTLIELLVVISIITILAGLTTVGVMSAIRAAQEGAIAVEIQAIGQALESYRSKFNALPPCETETPAGKVAFRKHMRRAFRNHTISDAVLDGIDLNPAEALFFFLGGGLSENSKNPLGPGSPIVLYEFDETRVNTAGTFPYYTAKYCDGAPFVYFDRNSYDRAFYTEANRGWVYPYQADSGNWPVGDFQIISSGRDGLFGDFATTPTPPTVPPLKQFPGGLNYSEGDLDNIANFSEGRFENALP